MSGNTLTVGFATFSDFDGCYFTVAGLRANHRPDVDLVCVDSHPLGCPRTRAAVEAGGGRYYHRPNLAGTSAPRDEVFRLAETPWVLVCDSHVLFETGAIDAAVRYADAHPASRDLVQGPLVYDNGGLATHWRPTHPPALWGVWDHDPRAGSGPAVLRGGRWVANPAPDAAGQAEPFEIPMQGLGVWLMRKAAWPGFNPLFTGFGGEEGYLHEVVRRRGGRALCLPALRWRHRFRDPVRETVPYPLRREDHVWNLLVGHREVGIDAVAAIRAEYGGGMDAAAFDALARGAAACQPWDRPGERPPPTRVLGVWYSNNGAPQSLLQASLRTIKRAADLSRAAVTVVCCPWSPVPGNPFRETIAAPGCRVGTGHQRICAQIRQAIGAAAESPQAPAPTRTSGAPAGEPGYDVVCFLEHDVLYPPDYFDRVALAFAQNPAASVVSNLDYEGLNATGWLGVKERHEPLHQLSMRAAVAAANLDRAERDCEAQGWALLEPQGDRADWVRLPPVGRMPAVHVNHTAGRFTSHGEVVYEAVSTRGTRHPFWGDAADWWPSPAAAPGCVPCGAKAAPPQPAATTLPDLLAAARDTPSDFHQHVNTLKDLADQCEVVAEIGIWDDKPALVALAASAAKTVVSVCPIEKRLWKRVQAVRPDLVTAAADGAVRDGVDLLFWDGQHRAEEVYRALATYAPHVRRYLVVHCTTAPYGETGDDGGPGVMPGVRRFLGEHREWTAVRHDPQNHGLIVLSRDDRDKKQPPGVIRKAMNFARALAKDVANGRRRVTDRVFELRMAECVVCPERTGDACAACGCPVDAKATWASEDCGLVKRGLPPKWTRTDDPADLEP